MPRDGNGHRPQIDHVDHNSVKFAPSILAADFARLGDQDPAKDPAHPRNDRAS
jgi:hypothetical protein